jgi:hypothetical protein
MDWQDGGVYPLVEESKLPSVRPRVIRFLLIMLAFPL